MFYAEFNNISTSPYIYKLAWYNIHSGIIAFTSDDHTTHALIGNGFKKCQRHPMRKSHNFQLDQWFIWVQSNP